jgi:hypothetical protein
MLGMVTAHSCDKTIRPVRIPEAVPEHWTIMAKQAPLFTDGNPSPNPSRIPLVPTTKGISAILLKMVNPIDPAVPEDTEVVKEATAWTPVSPAAKRNGNI